MSSIPLKGGKELAAFLSAFPMRLQKNAMRAAVRAAQKPIVEEARLRAPKDTGKLAKSIKGGNPRALPDGTVRTHISLKGKHSYLGYFHEYGVSPHIIAAKGAVDSSSKLGKSIRKQGKGALPAALYINGKFVPSVMHPGHRARPFLRPALDTRADDAIKAFGTKLSEYFKGKTGFTAPTLDLDED